jgi:hypothetical protein
MVKVSVSREGEFVREFIFNSQDPVTSVGLVKSYLEAEYFTDSEKAEYRIVGDARP